MAMGKINTVLSRENREMNFSNRWNFGRDRGEVQTVCTISVGFELQLRIRLSLTRRVRRYESNLLSNGRYGHGFLH